MQDIGKRGKRKCASRAPLETHYPNQPRTTTKGRQNQWQENERQTQKRRHSSIGRIQLIHACTEKEEGAGRSDTRHSFLRAKEQERQGTERATKRGGVTPRPHRNNTTTHKLESNNVTRKSMERNGSESQSSCTKKQNCSTPSLYYYPADLSFLSSVDVASQPR